MDESDGLYTIGERIMITKILKLFGYKTMYVCGWGVYSYKYDAVDYWMTRPIHKNMSVAPPWAKMIIVKFK